MESPVSEIRKTGEKARLNQHTRQSGSTGITRRPGATEHAPPDFIALLKLSHFHRIEPFAILITISGVPLNQILPDV
jgi:hypothetical protein